uniref:Uncharacterized protein n=1 Tax=Rhizophora mucronata TaxID=61149 RepID=A0A2P2QJV7_RHIMU
MTESLCRDSSADQPRTFSSWFSVVH